MAEIKARLALDSSNFSEGLNRASEEVSKFVAGFSALGGGLGGLFSAAGIVAGIKSAFSGAQDLFNRSIKTQVPVEELQRLSFAAEQFGTSEGSLDTALIRLQRNSQASQRHLKGLGDEIQLVAEDGEIVSISGNKATDAIRRLGLNAAKFNALSTAEQLQQIAAGLQRTGDLGAVFDLLGKGAGQLIPLLRAAKEEWEAFAAIKVESSQAVTEMRNLNVEFNKLKHSLEETGKEWAVFLTQVTYGSGALLRAHGEGLFRKFLLGDKNAQAEFNEQIKMLGEKGLLMGYHAPAPTVEPPALDLKSLTKVPKPEKTRDIFGEAIAAGRELLAQEKKEEAYKRELEHLRERLKLIGMTTEEELKYYEAKLNTQKSSINNAKTIEQVRDIGIEMLKTEIDIAQLKDKLSKGTKDDKEPKSAPDIAADQYAKMGLFSGNTTGALVDHMQKTAEHTRMIVDVLRNGITVLNGGLA
jgi:hypothetical protein